VGQLLLEGLADCQTDVEEVDERLDILDQLQTGFGGQGE